MSVPDHAVRLAERLRRAQTEEPELSDGEVTVSAPAAAGPAVLHHLPHPDRAARHAEVGVQVPVVPPDVPRQQGPEQELKTNFREFLVISITEKAPPRLERRRKSNIGTGRLVAKTLNAARISP